MVAHIQALPDGLNQPNNCRADTGYFSERNVRCFYTAKVEPLIAVGATRTIRTGTVVLNSPHRSRRRRAT